MKKQNVCTGVGCKCPVDILIEVEAHKNVIGFCENHTPKWAQPKKVVFSPPVNMFGVTKSWYKVIARANEVEYKGQKVKSLTFTV